MPKYETCLSKKEFFAPNSSPIFYYNMPKNRVRKNDTIKRVTRSSVLYETHVFLAPFLCTLLISLSVNNVHVSSSGASSCNPIVLKMTAVSAVTLDTHASKPHHTFTQHV